MLCAMGVMEVVGYTAVIQGDRTNRLPRDVEHRTNHLPRDVEHRKARGREGKAVPAYCWTPVKAGCRVSATDGLWAAKKNIIRSTAKGTACTETPLSLQGGVGKASAAGIKKKRAKFSS